MSKTTKTRLDIQKKTEILKKLDEGVSGKRLALDYGISTAAISKIKKKRHDIMKAVANSYESLPRKTLHKAEYADMEKNVYKWFLDQRQRNCVVDGTLIKARAKLEFERLYSGKQFSASEGWLTNFKKRHGIRRLKICGEVLSNDRTNITPFINQLRTKIDEMGITEAQLYNADESGLFYRMIPDKTFVAVNEKSAPGRKITKERVTFLLCANADGSHKLTPLVIGKSANPRCFSGFENPLEYGSSKNAWMNSHLFHTWFHHSFIKGVRKFSFENNLPPKALLLIDNCTAHKPIDMLRSEDGQILAILLPPNVTAIIQPMDQNPIRLVKLAYKNKLLCNIVAQENVPIQNILKEHSIRDAILLLKSAWDELPKTVLKNAWNKIRNWDDNEYDYEDNIPLCKLIEFNSYYNNSLQDVKLLCSIISKNTEISNEDIETWNKDELGQDDQDDQVEVDEDDEEYIVPTNEQPKVNYAEALQSINTLIKWYEHENDARHLAELINMRTIMVKKYINKEKKQTSIVSFFKPLTI